MMGSFHKHPGLFSKTLPENGDRGGCAIASACHTLLLDTRDCFNMGANLSSGLLSLRSPAVV